MNIQAYIQSGVIESYVLDMAEPEDVAELLRLSHLHPEVADAIRACEGWLRSTAAAGAVPASADIRQKLFGTLQDEFTAPVPPFQAVHTTAPPAQAAQAHAPADEVILHARRGNARLRLLAAAAVILFLASAGINLYLYKQYRKAARDNTALLNERNTMLADNNTYRTRLTTLYRNMQMMTEAGMLKVALSGVPGKEGNLVTLYWDTQKKDVYLITNKLPPAPDGSQYQLWALVNGKPVNAGVLEDCEGLCRLQAVQEAQAFAITLEKAGGSKSPTLDQLFVMGNVRS